MKGRRRRAGTQSAMDHMRRGERLHARGDKAGAEAAYRAAIAAGPELAVLAWAHFNLGIRLEQRGDKAGAEAAYRAAIAADPELERAHSQLGNHLFERGDNAGAEAAWRAAIAADSGGACGTAPYCNLGGLLAQGGDFASGACFFEAALKIDPSNAELQENVQNVQAALKEQRSAGAVRLGAELDHYERGRRLHNRGDKAGAEAAYRAAIATDPQDAHAHYNLGILLDRREDEAGAESAFRAAIAADPQLAQAHYNLGLLLEQRVDKAGAEAAYRAAIAADPELAVAHNNLGKHLFERSDNAGAEAAWRAAIAADPQGAGAYSNLGCVLAQGGNLAGGARFFEAALKIDPSNAELQENMQKVQAALKERQSAGAVRLDAEPFLGSRPYPMYRCPMCRQLGQIGDDSHSHRGVPCPPIPADAEVVMFHAGPSASGAGTRTAECNADGEIVGASGARNCSSCGERGKVKCSGCGLAYYCGAACQKAHWKAHRPACKRGQAERKEHAARIAASFGSGGSGLAAGGSFVSHGGATIHTTQDGRVCISGTRMQAADE